MLNLKLTINSCFSFFFLLNYNLLIHLFCLEEANKKFFGSQNLVFNLHLSYNLVLSEIETILIGYRYRY